MPPRRRRENSKQRYSVDEMMDIARDAQAAKDGKSRRRRSQQPVQQRRSLATKLLIAGLGCAVFIGGGMFVLNKANALRYASDGFKQEAQAALARLLGYQVVLGEIEVKGKNLEMTDALVEGGDTALVDTARLKGVTGALAFSSMLGNTWKFSSLDSYTLEAELQRPEGSPAGKGAAEAPDLKTGGYGLSSEPEAFVVRHARCRDANVFFGGGETGDRIEGVRFAVDAFGAQVDVAGSQGTLLWNRMPPLELESFSGGIRDGVFALKRARLSSGADDVILLEGEIGLGHGSDSLLSGTVENLPLAGLLPPYWSDRLSGILAATFSHSFKMVAGSGEPELKGRVKIRDFSLRGIPVLDVLALYTAEPSFGYIQIPLIEADITMSAGKLTLGNLKAQRPGLVQLDGELEVSADDLLSGQVRIGVPAAAFDRVRGGRPEYFVVDGKGVAWAEIGISGSLAAPLDDLTQRLSARVRERGAAVPSPASGEAVSAPGVPRVETPVPGKPARSGDPVNQALEDAFDSLINIR